MSRHHCVIVHYFAHTHVGSLVMVITQAYSNSPCEGLRTLLYLEDPGCSIAFTTKKLLHLILILNFKWEPILELFSTI